MARIDFTAAERRGLIALCALLAATLIAVALMRAPSCSRSPAAEPAPASLTDTAVTLPADTLTLIPASGRPKPRKKSPRPATRRPDGRERHHLDEPI